MNACELATEITRPTMWGRSPLVLDMASEGVVDTVGVARIGADPLPPEMLPTGAICGTAAGRQQSLAASANRPAARLTASKVDPTATATSEAGRAVPTPTVPAC